MLRHIAALIFIFAFLAVIEFQIDQEASGVERQSRGALDFLIAHDDAAVSQR